MSIPLEIEIPLEWTSSDIGRKEPSIGECQPPGRDERGAKIKALRLIVSTSGRTRAEESTTYTSFDLLRSVMEAIPGFPVCEKSNLSPAST